MSGGADYSRARRKMVDEQLLARGIVDPRVLDAMAQVPRERFVAPDETDLAYADRALPIAGSQTISQPYIVALMTQALSLTGGEHLLEIGTGSGYQTAILSLLAHDVVSIELDPDLSRGATGVLMELGCANVKFLVGDGSRGWPPDAPYDGILVAAAAAHCPPPLREQLAGGGVLVIPIGGPAWQELARIERRGTQYESEILTRCRFVPLVGAAGSDDE